MIAADGLHDRLPATDLNELMHMLSYAPESLTLERTDVDTADDIRDVIINYTPDNMGLPSLDDIIMYRFQAASEAYSADQSS